MLRNVDIPSGNQISEPGNNSGWCETQTVLIHLPQFIQIHATWASTWTAPTISAPAPSEHEVLLVHQTPRGAVVLQSHLWHPRACACQPACSAALASHCNGWQMPPITCYIVMPVKWGYDTAGPAIKTRVSLSIAVQCVSTMGKTVKARSTQNNNSYTTSLSSS